MWIRTYCPIYKKFVDVMILCSEYTRTGIHDVMDCDVAFCKDMANHKDCVVYKKIDIGSLFNGCKNVLNENESIENFEVTEDRYTRLFRRA